MISSKCLCRHATGVILPSRMPALLLQVLAKYNALFQHLLRLKRVNAELDAAWASLRRQAGAESLQSRQPIWDVRLHMAHLLLNLQVYMQVCTIGFPYLLKLSAPTPLLLSVRSAADLSRARLELGS